MIPLGGYNYSVHTYFHALSWAWQIVQLKSLVENYAKWRFQTVQRFFSLTCLLDAALEFDV